MKRFITILSLLFAINSFSQKIYVSCDDPKPKGSIEKKIKELNYIVVDDSSKADIIAKFVYRQLKNPVVSFKVKPNIEAKILFYDNKDMLLSITDEVGGLTGVWAGYNARIDAAWKILTRDFEQKLKEAISKLKDAPKEVKKESKQGNSLSVADELTKLKKLYDDGILTKDEFEAQKKKLLNQ